MQVFKFGGASVNNAERIRNLAAILASYPIEPTIVVISAIGKTTNALEQVTSAYFEGRSGDAIRLFERVKNDHLVLANQVLVSSRQICENQLLDFFTEVEWLLHEKPVRDFNYYYDQVVCTGELFSTCIISHYLSEAGVNNKWLDVRDIIRTDNDFRNASIDWHITQQNIKLIIIPALEKNTIIITQGFIGATDENESTTLGREGSDYSAAVFANILGAKNLTIWKDVQSVMNADPKQFPDAVSIPLLDYHEVIEMAYYGAQVIHPKTIKPLQNKNIPLFVKCFLDPSLPGTLIHYKPVHDLPPIIVLKENQVKLEMRSTDFSFIGEQHIGHIYHLMEKLHIKPNLTQNAAISFVCVLDDWPEKIENLALEASTFLEVSVTRGLSLLTIRHYSNELFEKLTKGKKILLRQQTEQTIQVLMQS
jgi:aspartate kinase